jgi:hypothetical protein
MKIAQTLLSEEIWFKLDWAKKLVKAVCSKLLFTKS